MRIRFRGVVPLAGTWIETEITGGATSKDTLSFPLRERGLKLTYAQLHTMYERRSPCGNVD